MKQPAPSSPGSGSPEIRFPKTDLRYWRDQLLRRKYVELARPGTQHEYFARIEHDGVAFYFALDTDDEVPAAVRALHIYQTVVTKGWRAARRAFPYEFTLAILWSNNPFACTYSTLLTDPNAALQPERPKPTLTKGFVRVAVLEPEEEVRATLVRWINRIPGYHCLSSTVTARDGSRPPGLKDVDLILANRNRPEPSGGGTADHAPSANPIATFEYGIYETSDDIFISISGVSGGYFLRRRPPHEVLDPIAAAWRGRSVAPEQLRLHIRRYIHDLFGDTPPKDDLQDRIKLTPREQEILLRLSKGYHDKQIADTLGISAWTVHNHLKNIFKKLAVHSRTEAVIRYLQK